MKVYEESLEEGGKKYSGCLIKVENASIALFDEKENVRLGTLAMGMPELDGRHYFSSVLLGDRNAMETKLLAERVSAATERIALVSVHMEPLTGFDSIRPLMRLAMKLIERSKKE